MEEATAEQHPTFSAADALQLVSKFFDKEWPQTTLADVQLRKITGGFVNRLHLITRNNEAIQEPSSILIRHFGHGRDSFREEPLASSTTLSAAEQALIYYEMGRRYWGPKLYGVFPGGRLEEYIDAHTLTPGEAIDQAVRHDSARTHARLHSLDLPFRKTNFKFVLHDLKEMAMKRKDATVAMLLKLENPNATALASCLQSIDLCHELNWVSSLFEKYYCKAAIAVADCNFLNVLVKNFESECRTMLIDYETCTYSYRGVDIGGHFNERMYCWSDPHTNLTGYPAPDIEEQRSFCRSYLQEMRDLELEMTETDTEEHLLVEAQIGRMWQLLFSFTMCFNMEELPNELPLFAGLAHMLETFGRLKNEWVEVEHAQIGQLASV